MGKRRKFKSYTLHKIPVEILAEVRRIATDETIRLDRRVSMQSTFVTLLTKGVESYRQKKVEP